MLLSQICLFYDPILRLTKYVSSFSHLSIEIKIQMRFFCFSDLAAAIARFENIGFNRIHYVVSRGCSNRMRQINFLSTFTNIFLLSR